MRDLGILRSEKRDLGEPGEGFLRELEIPKVRNGFWAQRGVAQGFGGSQGGVSVGEEAGERLPQAADGLSFHLVLAKAGPGRGWLWKVEGIGQRLGFVELGVRGSPGSSGGRLRHVLARFLGQLWLGGASSGTWATGPRLLCGGWPSAGHGTRLAGLAGRASRAWWFLGWALALLTTRWGPCGLGWSLTRDGCLPGSLWGARLSLGRWGGRWAGCWRCPRSSCYRSGLAALTLGQWWGLGHRLLGR